MFFLTRLPPPRSPLFPYTTLFRSRNLAGDPVNDFSVYRAGVPEKLSWLDNRRLGYLAPPDATKKLTALTFVVHDERQRGKRSEEHTSELQSQFHLVCRLLLEKKKT